MSETQTKCNTRKAIAKKQYTNMGKFTVTSKDKAKFDLEKTITAEKTMLNKTNPVTVPSSGSKVATLMNEVINARNYIVEEITSSFEKKLEKIDDAIVELINSKTENERLKGKIDNLTRENYRLKKEIESFKSIMPGVFIKVKKESINL